MGQETASRMAEVKHKKTSYRFSILLLAQFLLIAMFPLAGNNGLRPDIYGLFGMMVFLAGLYLVTDVRRLRIMGVVLFLPAIAGTYITFSDRVSHYAIPAGAFSIAFVAFVTAVILWTVLTSRRVTTETLFGAVVAYLFIGVVWGMAYLFVDQFAPGSLRYSNDPSRQLSWPDFTFFSFVTLTTIGYGDLVANGGIRALVLLEGIIGAMYPAILIGKLLTAYRPEDRIVNS